MSSSTNGKPGRTSSSGGGGDPLTLNLIKSLGQGKTGEENGSLNGGNNSDNSALVSIGNTSFGFNFDSEEGMSNNSTAQNSEQNDGSEDSDGNGPLDAKVRTGQGTANPMSQHASLKPSVSSLTASSTSNDSNVASAAHIAAAANAVASLQSIASSYAQQKHSEGKKQSASDGAAGRASRKHKATGKSDNESGGYNTDDEDGNNDRMAGSGGVAQATASLPLAAESAPGSPKGKKKQKRMDEKKREERNAREKERSFRISKQINELRNLLSSGGVIVPKGTKSSVLTEAANYIRMLQQHQYRSEIDRHQLVQQMQLIGSGAQGPQAAAAIRHVAAQNGVWSLGNFGGVPPKSAMTSFYQPVAGGDACATTAAAAGGTTSTTPDVQQSQPADEATGTAAGVVQPATVDPSEYRFVFNSCGVGMAIASMGGAFIDCNQLFSQISNYTKQEVCSLTIFNLTARQDLQHAFDLISQMISPPMDGAQAQEACKTIVLRGAMKNRNDIGLSVSLVKGDDGIAKCFCVTLIKNPASPFDSSKPIPVSFDSIMPLAVAAASSKEQGSGDLNASPAFTSG